MMLFCTLEVGTIKLLLAPNCSNIKYEFYGFSSDLTKRLLTNKFINVVRLFQ